MRGQDKEEAERCWRTHREDHYFAQIAYWLAALQHTVDHLFAKSRPRFQYKVADFLLRFGDGEVEAAVAPSRRKKKPGEIQLIDRGAGLTPEQRARKIVEVSAVAKGAWFPMFNAAEDAQGNIVPMDETQPLGIKVMPARYDIKIPPAPKPYGT